MTRIFYTTLIILIFLLGLAFAVLNAQSVSVNYYFGTLTLPVSLLLILTLLTGAVLGVMVCLGMVLRVRREASRCRKAAQLAEKELAQRRTLSHQSTQ